MHLGRMVSTSTNPLRHPARSFSRCLPSCAFGYTRSPRPIAPTTIHLAPTCIHLAPTSVHLAPVAKCVRTDPAKPACTDPDPPRTDREVRSHRPGAACLH